MNVCDIEEHSKMPKNEIKEINAKYYTCKRRNSNLVPVYQRDIVKETDLKFGFEEELEQKRETKSKGKDFDSRDLGAIHLEHLIENIQESLTVDKCRKNYDNSYLEFLGDGVISLLLAWDLILKRDYMDPSNQIDIDTLRIQYSSLRKLVELCKNAPIYQNMN